MRISIIGSGNIGGAIARGLAKGTMFKASDITCTAQSDETLEKMRKIDPDFILTHDNVEAARNHPELSCNYVTIIFDPPIIIQRTVGRETSGGFLCLWTMQNHPSALCAADGWFCVIEEVKTGMSVVMPNQPGQMLLLAGIQPLLQVGPVTNSCMEMSVLSVFNALLLYRSQQLSILLSGLKIISVKENA